MDAEQTAAAAEQSSTVVTGATITRLLRHQERARNRCTSESKEARERLAMDTARRRARLASETVEE